MTKENAVIKKDTTSNWNKAKNFIPKENEIIQYLDRKPIGIKIGNGINKLSDLPFVNPDYLIDGTTLIINSDIFQKGE